MPARRILFVDAVKLIALRWDSGKIVAEGEFRPDGTGLDAFAHYLRTNRRSLFYLLADVADEGFQTEEIPALFGGDRTAFVKRKLGQYFYGTPFSTAISLGRLKEGRRDERMLFAALTRPQQFEPWLAALAEAQAALVGMYAVPQLAARLGTEPAKRDKQFLLIAITTGGLRQTYFEDGQVRFSRLTTLATGSIEESSIACAIEAAKMHQYLLAQRSLARGTQLPVYILAHPAQANAYRERCRGTDELRFEILDLLAEAKRCGARAALRDSASQELFAHLLVRRTPREQFAPDTERRHYRYWQIRFALTSAGAVAFAGCLLFGAKTQLDTQRLKNEIVSIKAQTEQDRDRYRAVMERLPKIPLGIEDLRALIGRAEEIGKRSPGLDPMLIQVAAALDSAPQIELERLSWTIANKLDEPASSAPSAQNSASVATIPTAGPYVVLEINGTLPLNMARDHRGQLELINGFAARLKTTANTQVRILTLPFDTESGKAIKSSSGTVIETPRFAMRLAQSL